MLSDTVPETFRSREAKESQCSSIEGCSVKLFNEVAAPVESRGKTKKKCSFKKSVKNFVNYIKNIIFGASVATIAIKINL